MNKKKVTKKATMVVSKVATTATSTKDYAQTLLHVKKRIQEAQIKATMSVNKELIKVYWYIGKTIAQKQVLNGWGSGIVERFANDLQKEFTGLGGFSRTNVFRMKAFFEAYEKIPQAVGQLESLPIFDIPWGHNALLIERVKDLDQRIWYAQKAIDNGWSRSILEMQIKSSLYQRKGKAITNFSKALPNPDSDMAQQALKDPYIFDFLTLHTQHLESDLEQGLINHIQKFLLELGQGFAFVARQKHLEVGDADFYIDLLFYHLKLKCYVVAELKSTAFKPEYAGQLNFYLSAVDDLLRETDDKPTIGLILCKTKNNIVAEYALRKNMNPIGVASYETKLVESLPKNLKSSLPTIEEIEAEFEKQAVLAGAKVAKKTKAKK